MRCIAVRTTLSDEALELAGPTLIRDNIGSVLLNDILSGGSVIYKRMRGSETLHNFAESSSTVHAGGLQGSRHDILRFGSLGIAAMQYASPKAVWNQLCRLSPFYTKPGLSVHTENPQEVVESLIPLMEEAEAVVPYELHHRMPVKLGVRIPQLNTMKITLFN
ncbi:Protein SUPPRESSOR OF QUENCHING 1, chloroplastic [Glycine max]|nr:Protein SUPPRESSOR OF QUENCHING 1, chloroplastic [Glycine max]